MNNILITGGAGFIGHQLYLKFSKIKNVKPIPLDNLSTKPRIAPPKNLIRKDVLKISKKFLIEKKVHTIVHLAAKKNVKTSFVNLKESVQNYQMTLNLLSQCKDTFVKNIFIASSCEIFGYQKKKLDENSQFKPFSPYAVSKVAIEYLCDVFIKLNNKIKITSLVFFNTYGPTEGVDAVIPNFIYNAKKKNIITLEGNGNQARDFTYIDDTISLLEKIIFSKKYFRRINIGSGYDVKINKIVKIIKKKFKKLKIKKISKRPNEIKTFIADLRTLKKNFSYKPKINIFQGINKIIHDAN